MSKKDYGLLASKIIESIGGKENIATCFHCMTRLRFEIKDMSKVDDKNVQNIEGVIGTKDSGGMYQIIIGNDVVKVYTEVCKLADIQKQDTVDEDLDTPKEKLTIKSIFNKGLAYLSGCMVSLIPVMMAAGLTNALLAILGPDVLGVLSETSDTYILLKMIYNVGFYFLPIFVGYNAAKQLKMDPNLGAYVGAILIAPALIEMVNNGGSFTIFGINVVLNNYSQTVLPVALSVLFLKPVYTFLKKWIPDVMATVFVPVLTMSIVTPVSLLLLAPLGSIIGNAIGTGIIAFGESTGFIGVGLVSGIFGFLVIAGMHQVIGLTLMMNFFEVGYSSGIGAAAMSCTNWAIFGIALAAFLKFRNKNQKNIAFGCFISGIVGGVTEPTLYGICLKYARCFMAMFAGAFAGGCYIGLTNVKVYIMGAGNFLTFLSYGGGTTGNLINGTIALVIAFVVGCLVAYFFGFKKDEIADVELINE